MVSPTHMCWRYQNLPLSHWYRLPLFNSSSPSAAYMRQWAGSALVQIMACHSSAPSHYLKQCWFIVNWTLRNKIQWNSNQNTKIFIHENTFENISEMVAILSRGKWVKLTNEIWGDLILKIIWHHLASGPQNHMESLRLNPEKLLRKDLTL